MTGVQTCVFRSLKLAKSPWEGVPEEIRALIKERDAARKNKDFKKADELRAVLSQKGVTLKDTPAGTVPVY